MGGGKVTGGFAFRGSCASVTLSSLRSRPFCHFRLSAIQIWPIVGVFKFSVIFCSHPTLSSLRSRPFCRFWLSLFKFGQRSFFSEFSVIFCVSSHSVFTPVTPILPLLALGYSNLANCRNFHISSHFSVSSHSVFTPVAPGFGGFANS